MSVPSAVRPPAGGDSRIGAACPAGNVVRAFDRAVSLFPERIAVHDGDQSLTYRQTGELADAIGQGLGALGVQRGDRVGVLMPNCLAFIPALWGLWKAGAAFTQLSARGGVGDFEHHLETVGAKALIYHEMFDEAVEQIRPRLTHTDVFVRVGQSPDPSGAAVDLDDLARDHLGAPSPAAPADSELATVAFTSGTTGRPKAVVLDHARWSYYGIVPGMEVADIRPGEVFAHVAPLTHVSIIFVLPTLMRGGTNVVLPGFDIGRFAEIVERLGVTATALVPTIIYALLDAPGAMARLRSLQTIVYAGSPMSPTRLQEAISHLGPIFAQTYAGSEPGFVSWLPKEEHETDSDAGMRRLGSAGRPFYHVEVSIQADDDRELPVGEIGEICVRSPGQMMGYWDSALNDEAMRGDWVHTGDVGRLDDDGYLYIVDRKKDMIVTGGLNVFPAQVEEIVTALPAIAQCAVIGVPDDKWGEAVTAYCVTRPGATVEEEAVIEAVKARKGSVWAPKGVHFVDSLPLGPTGKVDKKALREPHWDGRQRLVN